VAFNQGAPLFRRIRARHGMGPGDGDDAMRCGLTVGLGAKGPGAGLLVGCAVHP